MAAPNRHVTILLPNFNGFHVIADSLIGNLSGSCSASSTFFPHICANLCYLWPKIDLQKFCVFSPSRFFLLVEM
jgi:hypothetical protein